MFYEKFRSEFFSKEREWIFNKNLDLVWIFKCGEKKIFILIKPILLWEIWFFLKKKGSDFYLKKCRLDFFIKNRPDFYKQNTDEIL